MKKPRPVMVFAPAPDDPLDVEKVAAILGVHPSSAYEVMRKINRHKPPEVGLIVRRDELYAYIYSDEYLQRPGGKIAPRKPGTRRAGRCSKEVLPGITGAELRAKAGLRG